MGKVYGKLLDSTKLLQKQKLAWGDSSDGKELALQTR